MTHHLSKPFILSAAIAGIAAQQASATLTLDLRAISVNGIPTLNPKSVTVAPNDLVTFQLFAVVTGPTEAAGLEGFQIAVGSILSNTSLTGGKGNVETRQFDGVFGAAGATLGTIVDLDADGDLDIGDNATAAAVAANVSLRSAAMTTGNATGLGASEFDLYQFTFRVTSPGADNQISVNWRKTDFTGLTTEYIWQENGVLTNSRGVNGGTVALVGVGLPVLVAVPEPSAFGMVLLGAMGLVGFRRMGLRRS